jgi:CubicO group peptidase (beta-lactamase class C family)
MTSHRTKSRYALLCLIVFACFALLPSSARSEEITAKVDAYMTPLVEKRIFSGTILVAKGGKILVNKGYGLANYEHNIPNTGKTKFRIGSVTKQFTAVAIMQLVEKGKVSLKAHISEYLPYFRKDIDPKITVHNLLVHSSGLPNYTDLPGFYAKHSRNPYEVKDFITQFCSGDLEFEPGSTWKYSNSGYFILGAIIEAVTGQTYADYLKEHIFGPAGMEDSGYDNPETILENRATGYRMGQNGLENCEYLDMSIPYAAGSLYSTTEDLYKWDRILYTEKILTERSKELMFTPYIAYYGYGWFIAPKNGHTNYSHSGGINGFVCNFARYVEDDACIVVLANREKAQEGYIASALNAILFGHPHDPPGKPASIPVAPGILKKYVGRYDVNKMIFPVSLKDKTLYGQILGLTLPFDAVSETRFLCRFTDFMMTFVTDSKGKAISVILHQGSADLTGARIED